MYVWRGAGDVCMGDSGCFLRSQPGTTASTYSSTYAWMYDYMYLTHILLVNSRQIIFWFIVSTMYVCMYVGWSHGSLICRAEGSWGGGRLLEGAAGANDDTVSGETVSFMYPLYVLLCVCSVCVCMYVCVYECVDLTQQPLLCVCTTGKKRSSSEQTTDHAHRKNRE